VTSRSHSKINQKKKPRRSVRQPDGVAEVRVDGYSSPKASTLAAVHANEMRGREEETTS